MRVIGHTLDGNQFLAFSRDNSRDVFLQLLAMRVGNHASAIRDREDNMQIDLRVRIRHFLQPGMALLAELIT